MNMKVKRLLGKALTVATLVAAAMQFNAAPAFAGTPTLLKDTLDTVKVSVSATHSLSMTLPTGGITTGNTLTVTYTSFGTDFAGAPTVSCGAGTATAGFATNVLTLTGGGTACTTTLTVTPFTGTNPGSAGSYPITLAGTAGITGSFAIAIVTNDAVSITASVDPTITFNVGAQASATACDGTFSGNGGTVALGTLTTSAVTSSDASSVPHVCTRVTTNAANGAIVTVKSLNAALKSTSVPGDTIPSATATPLATSTRGYGLCGGSSSDSGKDTTTPTGSTPVAASPFNGTCTSTDHNIGALTTSPQTVWSIAGASQNAYFRLYVKAGVSGTVPAHNDYTDSLTFVATGTF
jgi:hypothetical protein